MTQGEIQTRLDIMFYFISEYRKHKQENDKKRALIQAVLIYTGIGNIINSLKNH